MHAALGQYSMQNSFDFHGMDKRKSTDFQYENVLNKQPRFQKSTLQSGLLAFGLCVAPSSSVDQIIYYL